MEIIVGKTAGFCYGVKRAVEGAKKELNINPKLSCLGEIVHNKQVIKELESQGIEFIENIKDSAGTTVIRAHGVPKQIYEIAKECNIEIKDYTCPNVLKIHKISDEYYKKGYYIFLCGSKNHPENIGTISHCSNNYSIIEKEEDIEETIKDFKETKMEKILIIAQTTYSVQKFSKIEKKIREIIGEEIEIITKNTICKATELRQIETEEISKKVDYMIIIGGKNSSNTKKLYEIARENCENSICIETKKELNIEDIKKYKKVGIMAGASTPQSSISEVVEAIS